MNNSFMNLSEMPERTFEDPQNREVHPWEQVFKKCDCGRDIMMNEEYWNINGVTYCQDCIKEHIDDYLSEFRKVAE